jgi:hypothetical protein
LKKIRLEIGLDLNPTRVRLAGFRTQKGSKPAMVGPMQR